MPRRRRARDGDAASSQGGDDAASSVGAESRADGAEAAEQSQGGKVKATHRTQGGERVRHPATTRAFCPFRCLFAHIPPCVNVDWIFGLRAGP